MKTNKILFLIFVSLFSLNLISAVPGIPHQFYGSVTVNGQSAPDNNVIKAVVNGDEYVTVTTNGLYGNSPNIFYVEDPNGNRAGDTIIFYLGGKKIGSFTFINSKLENFNIDTTTIKGDGFCLGDETCASTPEDCGKCTSPPIITIISPENKVYNTNKIDLTVSSNQNIIVWMYSLNGANPITFTPNIIITGFVDEETRIGENSLIVIGLNDQYTSGTSSVSFTVELPSEYCGDAICNNGEDCNSCSADCGVCPPPSSSGGGGGGGSGSGGSITKKTNLTTPATSAQSNSNVNLSISAEEGDENTEENNKRTEETGVLSGITGAVIGLAKTKAGIGIGIALVIIILGIVVLVAQKKNKQQA